MVKKSSSRVEQFLAAPDSLQRSAIERSKALNRKARLHAEAEQLRASKSKRQPSVEDVLADLLRAASDKDTNPFWKFKSLSRRRYELYGYYPISIIDQMFGQFEHAKQVAGLADQPGTRAKKIARSEASRTEHAARYMKRHITPYVVSEPDHMRALAGTKLILSISDTHATFLDPFVWYSFLSACRDLRPDVVYMNGDILEGSEISRFPKIPSWTIPLQLEFDFAREMFRMAREVCPDAEIFWSAGNHGLDRLARYLTQVAPAFANLDSLRFDELAGVQKYGVKLAQGGTIASPKGTEDDAVGSLLYGFYRVHHGTKLGEGPALAELRAAGRSGQSGHVHRAGLAFGTTEQHQGLSWMSTPMGCGPRAGRAYMPKSPTTGWQRGFGLAVLGPGTNVHQYPVICENDNCFVEGYHYRWLKAWKKEPDVQVNWLKGCSL